MVGGVVAMQMAGQSLAVRTIIVRMPVLGDLGGKFQMAFGFSLGNGERIMRGRGTRRSEQQR